MTLYSYDHHQSVAEFVLKTMSREINLPVLRTWKRNLAVTRHTHVPSILVETGYLMHPDDNWLLLHPATQWEVARAIKEGIKEYFLMLKE